LGPWLDAIGIYRLATFQGPGPQVKIIHRHNWGHCCAKFQVVDDVQTEVEVVTGTGLDTDQKVHPEGRFLGPKIKDQR